MFQKVQKPNSYQQKSLMDLKKRFLKDFLLVSELKGIKQSQDGKIITQEGNGYANLKSQSKIQVEDVIEFKLKLLSLFPFGSLHISVWNMENSSTYFSFYGCQFQVLQPIFLSGGETLQFILDMTQQKIQCIVDNQTIQKDLIKERSLSHSSSKIVENWFPEGLVKDPSSEWYLQICLMDCSIQILDE